MTKNEAYELGYEPNDDVEIVDQELLQKERLKKLKQRAVGRKSKAKGGRYENALSNKIASYFGWSGKDAFVLTRNNPKYGQSGGDLVPIRQMAEMWYSRKLGPLEAKSREEWTFSQFFTDNPEKNPVYQYWLESNLKTNSDKSIIFFTKNHLPDFVFHKLDHATITDKSYLLFRVEEETFVVQKLTDFLKANFDLD